MTDEAPHVPAAFINAISEEGTKAEAVAFLQKQWNENRVLWHRIRKLEHDNNQAAGRIMDLEKAAEAVCGYDYAENTCVELQHDIEALRRLLPDVDAPGAARTPGESLMTTGEAKIIAARRSGGVANQPTHPMTQQEMAAKWQEAVEMAEQSLNEVLRLREMLRGVAQDLIASGRDLK